MSKQTLIQEKGITLAILVITIIVMLILVGVIVTISIDGNIFNQAKRATSQYNNAKYIQEIKEVYMMAVDEADMNDSNEEIFEKIIERLSFEKETYEINPRYMRITTKDENVYTLLGDGTVIEGMFAYLDISEGTIQIKSNGYIQGNNALVEYTGKYIITGTTSTNTVKIMDTGDFDIILKDLNIDVSSINLMCAFNANASFKPTGCFVTITLEGKNKLYGGGSAAALGFAKATPNINGVTNGSTLTINGDGKLEAVGGGFGAGIGSGYGYNSAAAGAANNITINSGDIIAKSTSHAAAIGGGFRQNACNITINGGNITAIPGSSMGIGASYDSTLEKLTINGGNITVSGGEIGSAIGGKTGSGEILITGGIINASHTDAGRASKNYATIGHNCSSIKITGGTIICKSPRGIGIGTGTGGAENVDEEIEVTGGNLIITTGTVDSTNASNFSIQPISEENNVHLTPIQLSGVKEKIQITSLKTSDNIQYGIKDMYATEDDKSTESTNEGGILYIYLPKGSRTITVEAGNATYSGTVQTNEINTLVVLNKV